jgi:hypothetical protein
MRKKWVPEKKHVVGVRPELPDGVVKSAGRVLQILEYFDEIQRTANVVEIAEMLKLPQSSTSALLRSLVAMGYLYFDRMARTYVPSCKVALLGNWVNSPLFMGGVVLQCMEELRERTGDARHARYACRTFPAQPLAGPMRRPGLGAQLREHLPQPSCGAVPGRISFRRTAWHGA